MSTPRRYTLASQLWHEGSTIHTRTGGAWHVLLLGAFDQHVAIDMAAETITVHTRRAWAAAPERVIPFTRIWHLAMASMGLGGAAATATSPAAPWELRTVYAVLRPDREHLALGRFTEGRDTVAGWQGGDPTFVQALQDALRVGFGPWSPVGTYRHGSPGGGPRPTPDAPSPPPISFRPEGIELTTAAAGAHGCPACGREQFVPEPECRFCGAAMDGGVTGT